jgi:hypothetical protein
LVAVGDVNGDGYADVVVSGEVNNGAANGVFIYNGASGGISSTPTKTVNDPGGFAQFGASLFLSYVTGDGYADLIVGDAVDNETTTGTVYLYNGAMSGVPLSPSSTLADPTGGEAFGLNVE